LVATWQQQLDKVFSGSPVPLSVETATREDPTWDEKPFEFLVGGVRTEFFSIGHLAKALGDRKPGTIRKWEQEGIIPKSPYTKPSDDPRGRRRMYTRVMVEGMVTIAKEEGVLFPHKGVKLSETQFSPRVLSLFQSLTRK